MAIFFENVCYFFGLCLLLKGRHMMDQLGEREKKGPKGFV